MLTIEQESFARVSVEHRWLVQTPVTTALVLLNVMRSVAFRVLTEASPHLTHPVENALSNSPRPVTERL